MTGKKRRRCSNVEQQRSATTEIRRPREVGRSLFTHPSGAAAITAVVVATVDAVVAATTTAAATAVAAAAFPTVTIVAAVDDATVVTVTVTVAVAVAAGGQVFWTLSRMTILLQHSTTTTISHFCCKAEVVYSGSNHKSQKNSLNPENVQNAKTLSR